MIDISEKEPSPWIIPHRSARLEPCSTVRETLCRICTRSKKWVDLTASLGYNTLLLYTEDTYEVPDEPYFGYMRGRYSQAELRELDAYAKKNRA